MATTGWDSFFVASSGATAALAGLIFVAISLNLDQILAVPGLVLRAREALGLLVGALLMSILTLIPGQAPVAFAVEAGLTAAVLAVLSTRATIRMLPVRRRYPAVFVLKVVFAVACVPPYAVGALTVADVSVSPTWLAAGIALSILSASNSAWVLLVEISRDRTRS